VEEPKERKGYFDKAYCQYRSLSMPHLTEMATMPLCGLKHDNNDRRRGDPHHYLASDPHNRQRLDVHLLHRHVRQMPTLPRNRAY
jgi:hypothetical protein